MLRTSARAGRARLFNCFLPSRGLATGKAKFPSSSTAPAPTAEGRRRIGFRVRLTCKPELLEKYKEAHKSVWPDMQDALRRSGWHNYSLFLGDDGVMFGYFEADTTFNDSLDNMGKEAINKTWQDAMKVFVPDVDPLNVGAATVGRKVGGWVACRWLMHRGDPPAAPASAAAEIWITPLAVFYASLFVGREFPCVLNFMIQHAAARSVDGGAGARHVHWRRQAA
jgi:L-rhamnose mutarotase